MSRLVLSAYVFLGGFTSFLGYPLNLPALTDWNNEGISIQPNTYDRRNGRRV
jgi:hypothetical protein